MLKQKRERTDWLTICLHYNVLNLYRLSIVPQRVCLALLVMSSPALWTLSPIKESGMPLYALCKFLGPALRLLKRWDTTDKLSCFC